LGRLHPRCQVVAFNAPYNPLGGARELWRCHAPEILIDGPAGTGKTRAVLEKVYVLINNWPGARVLLVRKTRAAMSETVLVTWETKVLPFGSPLLAGPNRHCRTTYEHPNGSRVVLGGLDNVDRILSGEYDLIVAHEATEITENDWEKLLTRLRNGVVPYQQGIAECNPGYPAHWLKVRADAGRMTRILSRHTDNPSLTPEYLERLSHLTGHRHARLFLGQWAAAEGLVYAAWDAPKFVRDRKAHWERAILSVDEGYANPASVGFWLVDNDSYPHRVDEFYHAGQLESAVVGACRRFMEIAKRKHKLDLEAVIVDPSAAKLIAALEEDGFPVQQADNDVLPGIASLQERLTLDAQGRPRITISPKCAAFKAEIESYQWAENRDGSRADKPVKHNDHSMDETRYFSRYLDAYAGKFLEVAAV